MQRQVERDEYFYILQLCECYKVEALKWHLIAIGHYPKMKQDKIIDFI